MKKYFTLIELLVVIAIVSILASILLPALAKAKDTAVAATCVSNQKQCLMLMSLYGDDFDSLMPTYTKGYGLTSSWAGWAWFLNRAGLTTMKETTRELLCPQAPEYVGNPVFLLRWRTYGANRWHMAPGTTATYSQFSRTTSTTQYYIFRKIVKPVETAALIDSYDPVTNDGQCHANVAAAGWGYARAQHSTGKVVTGMADGHVESITINRLAEIYPIDKVGAYAWATNTAF